MVFGHIWTHFEKPFFPLVGEKCCNTTILHPQQLKTVGVGLTFQPFVGATFTSFVGPTIFVSHKTVGPTKVRKVAPQKSQKSPQQF